MGIIDDVSPAFFDSVARAASLRPATPPSAPPRAGDQHVRHPGAELLLGHRQRRPRAARPPTRVRRDGRRGAAGLPGCRGGSRTSGGGALGRPHRDGHRRGHRRRQYKHQGSTNILASQTTEATYCLASSL